jgi:hypothetical protein
MCTFSPYNTQDTTKERCSHPTLTAALHAAAPWHKLPAVPAALSPTVRWAPHNQCTATLCDMRCDCWPLWAGQSDATGMCMLRSGMHRTALKLGQMVCSHSGVAMQGSMGG